MPKKKANPEEIKEALRKEIIRLGIQDNPSRTIYQKEYHRGEAPSPNNVMTITGEKWKELMEELGFLYQGVKGNGKFTADTKKALQGTRGAQLDFNNEEIRKEYIKRAIHKIHERGYTSIDDLNNFKNEIGVSFGTLSKYGINWTLLKKEYKKEYGEELGKRISRWSNKTNKEILDIVLDYMHEHGLERFVDYTNAVKGDKELPSSGTVTKKLNMTFGEVSKMIQNLV